LQSKDEDREQEERESGGTW